MAPTYSYYRRSTSDKGVPQYEFYRDGEDNPFVLPQGDLADSYAKRMEDRTDMMSSPDLSLQNDPGMDVPPRYPEDNDPRLAQRMDDVDPNWKAPAPASAAAPAAPPPPAPKPAAPAGPAAPAAPMGRPVGVKPPPLPGRPGGPTAPEPPDTRVGRLAEDARKGKYGDLSLTTEGSSSSQESGERRVYSPEAQEIIDRVNARMEAQEAAFAQAEQARRYHEDEARKLEYSKRGVDEEYDRKMLDLEKKRIADIEKYNQEIEQERAALKDPKDYWKDKGVGSQILMGIAVALGAIGTRPGEENQGVRILNDALNNHMRMKEAAYRKAMEARGRTNEDYELMQQRLMVDRLQALKQVQYQVADQISQSLNPTYRKEFMEEVQTDLDNIQPEPLSWQQQVAQDAGKGGDYSPRVPAPATQPNDMEVRHGGATSSPQAGAVLRGKNGAPDVLLNIPPSRAEYEEGPLDNARAVPVAKQPQTAAGRRADADLARAGAPTARAAAPGKPAVAPVPEVRGGTSVPPVDQRVDMGRRDTPPPGQLRTAPSGRFQGGAEEPAPAPARGPQGAAPAPAPRGQRAATPAGRRAATPAGRRADADLARVGGEAQAALSSDTATRVDPEVQKVEALRALRDYNEGMRLYREGRRDTPPKPLEPEQLRLLFQGVREDVKATPKEEKTSKKPGTPPMTPAQRAALEALQRIQRGTDRAAGGGPSLGGVTSTPAERSILESWRKQSTSAPAPKKVK